jgi:hypothetical protein
MGKSTIIAYEYSTTQLNDQLKIFNLSASDQDKLQQVINNKRNAVWSKT